MALNSCPAKAAVSICNIKALHRSEFVTPKAYSLKGQTQRIVNSRKGDVTSVVIRQSYP